MDAGKQKRSDLIKHLTTQVAAKGSAVKKETKPAQKPPLAAEKAPAASPPAGMPPISRMRRPAQPKRDFSRERISTRMFAGWKKSLESENSPKKVEETVKNILEGKKDNFTGYIEIEFEDNHLMGINELPVEIDESVKKVIIHKSKFKAIVEFFENPLDATKEISDLAEGIPKEKVLKAIELGAENIIKSPSIKLDGTVEYSISASVNET